MSLLHVSVLEIGRCLYCKYFLSPMNLATDVWVHTNYMNHRNFNKIHLNFRISGFHVFFFVGFCPFKRFLGKFSPIIHWIHGPWPTNFSGSLISGSLKGIEKLGIFTSQHTQVKRQQRVDINNYIPWFTKENDMI